jgi:hypothetical protein
MKDFLTTSQRLNLTIGNIKFQKEIYGFDLEKLEEVLTRVKDLEQQNEILKSRILNLKYNTEIRIK